MIEYNSKEEEVMIVLHDLLRDDGDGGLLEPTLFSIHNKLESKEDLSKGDLTRVLRQLDQNGHIKAPEAFRPRHHDPSVYITPKGWRGLDKMGREIPHSWMEAQKEILELLYSEEKQKWDDARSNIHLSYSQVEQEVDLPKGVFNVVLGYLLENEFILSEEEGYIINERGAQAYENEEYMGEPRAFQ